MEENFLCGVVREGKQENGIACGGKVTKKLEIQNKVTNKRRKLSCPHPCGNLPHKRMFATGGVDGKSAIDKKYRRPTHRISESPSKRFSARWRHCCGQEDCGHQRSNVERTFRELHTLRKTYIRFAVVPAQVVL